MSRPFAGLRLGLGVLRNEGPQATIRRGLDRLAAARRRRSFRSLGSFEPRDLGAIRPPSGFRVLNLLPTAPRPDLGGVQTQLLRRLGAEERPKALLSLEGGGYRLELEDGDERRSLTLAAPPPTPAPESRDPALEEVLGAVREWLGVEIVHAEQLAGLPLESVLRCLERDQDRGRARWVISAHDFVLFCPRPHLLERPELRFCDYSREGARCHACLRQDWAVAEGFQGQRRQVAAEILRRASAVIYPSDFLRRTYAELFPGLEGDGHLVVEPPSVVSGSGLGPAGGPAPGPVRHLAYVGAVKAHKGAPLLEALIDRFPAGRFSTEKAPGLRWSVLGGGDREVLARLRRRPGVRVRGYYRSGTLPRQLRREGVDLALLLSTWPESYALTLDECIQAGVPALAFDLGAVGDRLREAGGGLALAPSAGLEGLSSTLAGLISGEIPIPPCSRPLEDLPTGRSAARAVQRIYGLAT